MSVFPHLFPFPILPAFPLHQPEVLLLQNKYKESSQKILIAVQFVHWHCCELYFLAFLLPLLCPILLHPSLHQCATCGKRFRQLPHLQDHERIHSGLRPFCCWICGKSFSVAARLTEHARTHSGEKPYSCSHCPAAFRSRSNLDKHIRLHGDLPLDAAEQAVHEAAEVQKVLEGAKVLSSLPTSGEVETASVQTIYVLQGGEGGTETVMIPSDQLSGMDGTSQVVILPSSVLEAQGITVPTITMDGNEITMVETSQSPQHAIEFIVEETV